MAAQHVMDLAARLGPLITLDDAGIPADAEAAMALPWPSSLWVREYPRPTNPEPLDEAKLSERLKAMRTGDLQAAFSVTSAGKANSFAN